MLSRQSELMLNRVLYRYVPHNDVSVSDVAHNDVSVSYGPHIRRWSHTIRGSVRSTRGLGPNMTARGQSIGISIGMLPQTLIMSITVQNTSKYYTTEFDLEEGFFF